MLTSKGEQEALALAAFLKSQDLAKLYYSPFERAARTALIVAEANEIPAIEEAGLAEWRMIDEAEMRVRQRMVSVFNTAAKESTGRGAVGLVSHGGPIALLLQELGIDPEELKRHRMMFDTTNPLPPAGTWLVEGKDEDEKWRLELVFRPGS